ncbi:MAG: hypothetical protein ACLS76_15580, partial [Eubacterium callanderi]
MLKGGRGSGVSVISVFSLVWS